MHKIIDLKAILESVRPDLPSIATAKRPEFWYDVRLQGLEKNAKSKRISELEDEWQSRENVKKYKAINGNGDCFECYSPYKNDENYTDKDGRYWVVKYKPQPLAVNQERPQKRSFSERQERRAYKD